MKKINSLFIVLAISTFAYCQNIRNDSENMNKIKRIQIESVDFSTMTFLSVECNEFEKYFKEYRTVSITNPKTINEFLRHLAKLEQIDSAYSKAVDTRAKVKLFAEADTSVMSTVI